MGGSEEGEKGTVGADLVAPNLFGDVIQRLYNPQTKLLPLLIFRDGDVFDVAYFAEIVYTAALTPLASASLSINETLFVRSFCLSQLL